MDNSKILKAGMRTIKGVKVADELYEAVQENASKYEGGQDELCRRALAREVGLLPDLITVNLEDLPNRTLTISAKVSIDTMHSINTQANQANVENTEFAGEVLERFASSSVIAKGEFVEDDERMKMFGDFTELCEALFLKNGDESQSFVDFMEDVLRLGINTKQFELKHEVDSLGYIENLETRIAQYENPDEESQKKAVIIQIDQIVDENVKNELVNFGFNEDKYMTHDRESSLKSQLTIAKNYQSGIDDKISKIQSENKELVAEQTAIINASVEIVKLYEKSGTLFGIWTRKTREELAQMFPQRYRHFFK